MRLGVALLAVLFALPTPPPLPSPRPVTETYFGVRVTDPYRYFENPNLPAVQRFYKEQGAYTKRVLEGLGAPRQQIHARIHYLDSILTGVSDVNRVENVYFFQLLKPGWPSSRLFVRAASGGPARLLVDPDRFVKKRGDHMTIDFTAPSLDGKYVAFGISANGSEEDVTHVVRVSDGKLLQESITRTRFGVTGWTLDGKAFFYNRLPQLPPNAPPAENGLRPIVYEHVLGTNPEHDRAVFGIGINRGVAMSPADIGEVAESPGSRWLLGVVAHGVLNEVTIYAETISDLRAKRDAWRKIVDVDNDVTGAVAYHDTLYLQTHHHAPNYKVVAIDMAHPNFANASLVVPEQSSRVLEGLDLARDGLYVQTRKGGHGPAATLPHREGRENDAGRHRSIAVRRQRHRPDERSARRWRDVRAHVVDEDGAVLRDAPGSHRLRHAPEATVSVRSPNL